MTSHQQDQHMLFLVPVYAVFFPAGNTLTKMIVKKQDLDFELHIHFGMVRVVFRCDSRMEVCSPDVNTK